MRRRVTPTGALAGGLHASAKFDLVTRYQKLLAFYERHSLADEAQWTKRVLSRLTAP